MNITFGVSSVFNPRSSQTEDADTLRVLLESLIGVNRVFLRNHTVPSLYRSGVVYGRTKIWDSIPDLYRRGYGDCKSLSAARIAELREKGIECSPVFRFYVRPDGFKDFHILVLCGSKFEDPSKKCGMGDEKMTFRKA